MFKNRRVSTAGKKSFLTASDGKNYETMIYNLEMILSVGYIVKSKRGNVFRRWATKVLDSYLFCKLGTDISTCNYMPGFTIENFIDISGIEI